MDEAGGVRRKRGFGRGRAFAGDAQSGAWYPRWFWPSFTSPAIAWQSIFFVGSMYMILAVAFGAVDIFRNPVPVVQPWYWDFSRLTETVGQILSSDGLYRPIYVRTVVYVGIASSACLVIGYAVAYFVAFHAGRRRALFVVLIVAPIWISYVMRMYAWQGLLLEDGLMNRLLLFLPWMNHPVNWLDGRSVTVILGLGYGYLPYLILPVFAQLSRVEPMLLQAAGDLGAGRVQTFIRVTLPQSKQGVMAGLVIITLPMMGDYFTNTMLSGSPRTMMVGNIIDDSVNLPGLGATGAIVALSLVLLLFVPMLLYMRATRTAASAL